MVSRSKGAEGTELNEVLQHCLRAGVSSYVSFERKTPLAQIIYEPLRYVW